MGILYTSPVFSVWWLKQHTVKQGRYGLFKLFKKNLHSIDVHVFSNSDGTKFVNDVKSPLPAPLVVEMLQSLHSLQQENQRLQDQILSLTAKKERLQLLNTELAVPFPPHAHSAHGSLHTSTQINFLSSTQGQILNVFFLLSY